MKLGTRLAKNMILVYDPDTENWALIEKVDGKTKMPKKIDAQTANSLMMSRLCGLLEKALKK